MSPQKRDTLKEKEHLEKYMPEQYKHIISVIIENDSIEFIANAPRIIKDVEKNYKDKNPEISDEDKLQLRAYLINMTDLDSIKQMTTLKTYAVDLKVIVELLQRARQYYLNELSSKYIIKQQVKDMKTEYSMIRGNIIKIMAKGVSEDMIKLIKNKKRYVPVTVDFLNKIIQGQEKINKKSSSRRSSRGSSTSVSTANRPTLVRRQSSASWNSYMRKRNPKEDF